MRIDEPLLPLLNTPSILVVDDDKHMRDLLLAHLASGGYGVAVAEDARAARRLLLQSAPDLIIIDVQLPYRNGLDFVSTLLAESSVPRVPLVFLSSHDQFASTARVLGAGFLLKPFLKEDLLNTVSRTLAGKADDVRAADSVFPGDELPGLHHEIAYADMTRGEAK